MGNLFCGDFYEPQTGLSIPKIDEEPITLEYAHKARVNFVSIASPLELVKFSKILTNNGPFSNGFIF